MSDNQQSPRPQLTNVPTEPTPVILGPKLVPVGKILKPEELSKAEREELIRQGWDGESDVPSNLGDFITVDNTSQLTQAITAASQQRPSDFKLPTKDLDVSKIQVVEIDEAPEDLMRKYRELTGQPTSPPPAPKATNAFEQARMAGISQIKEVQANSGLHPDVAQAVRELEMPESIPAPLPANDPTPEPEPAANRQTEPVETAKPPARYISPEDQAKQRIAVLKRLPTEEDRREFAAAIFGGYPFTKTYSILGGKVTLAFREPAPLDEEEIQRQVMIDRAAGRIPLDINAITDATTRYNIATTLLRVDLEGQAAARHEVPTTTTVTDYIGSLVVPGNFKVHDFHAGDRPIRGWSQFIRTVALASSLYALVRMKYEEFSRLLVGLRLSAQDEDFFDVPTSQD